MAKKVTVQYRQLKTEGLLEGVELKAIVTDVLQSRGWAENAKLRILSLDQDGSVVILNKVSPLATWAGPIFAGQLIHLQSGTDVHAVTQSLDDDTTEFVLKHLDIGERTRVLKGALYFAVVGNHLGLIEGQEVRGRTLERYLTVLLQKADVFEAGQVVVLNSKFMAGNGKELSESSEITVAAARSPAPSARQRQAEDEPRIVEREAAAEREHEQATVFDILRLLGWDEKAIDSLGEEIPPDGWVEGFFKIFIKERRKRKPISRNTINEALRNIDPADLGLKGDGSEKNGIVKLSITRDVKTAGPGSLLDPESAMEQIVNALRDWSATGKIDCRFDA